WADASGRPGWKEWADANRPPNDPAEAEARAVVSGEVDELMRAGKYAQAAQRASEAAGRGPGWKEWADKLHQRDQDNWRQSEGEGVAQLLKAGKYADAAKLVRDAAGRGAGWKPWADGQHQRIRGDWQAYARREADAGRRAAIFDAYL